MALSVSGIGASRTLDGAACCRCKRQPPSAIGALAFPDWRAISQPLAECISASPRTSCGQVNLAYDAVLLLVYVRSSTQRDLASQSTSQSGPYLNSRRLKTLLYLPTVPWAAFRTRLAFVHYDV